MILVSAVMVLSIFGVDYLADLLLPSSKIPFGPISMLLMIVPITRIRRAGRPEEFQSYSIKRRLITITALLIFSTIAFTVVDYILFYLVK
jgi:hypothetical protein